MQRHERHSRSLENAGRYRLGVIVSVSVGIGIGPVLLNRSHASRVAA
ncbi:MAG: hypothetical protein QOG58_2657 [Caballeronia sp.]|nr:hypothetical protein [Caballeronia sp.]